MIASPFTPSDATQFTSPGTSSDVVVCPDCGCRIAVEPMAEFVYVNNEPPPRSPTKATKPVPGVDPPSPPTWLPRWPARIVTRDKPRPGVTRKQPRMRAGSRKVEQRLQLQIQKEM